MSFGRTRLVALQPDGHLLASDLTQITDVARWMLYRIIVRTVQNKGIPYKQIRVSI